ncbi:MAG: hypothetical protein DI527_00805 [Chelatococcus sp.]|nr:MAG: hypothetical protein DI527_00805 [Chelatococcus sp.]
MLSIVIVLLCGALNRARGDASWLGNLPGRALWYVTPVIGLLALLAHGWAVAGAFALAYLFWAVWPWGRWFDLGRLPVDPLRPISAFEHIIDALAGNSDHRALLWRHLMIAPGLVLIGIAGTGLWVVLLAPIFAAVVVALYEAAWRLRPTAPILWAEIGVGALWGGLIAFL